MKERKHPEAQSKIHIPNWDWCCQRCYFDAVPTLISPMFISGVGYINLCPKCALKTRNEIHGLPESMPFQGEMAQDMYEQQLEWEETHEP